MGKILKFKSKKQKRRILSLMLLAGLAIGAVVGWYFPQDGLLRTDETPIFSQSETDIVGRAIVTDGDTIRINGQRIRFHGIDAPEIDQTCTVDGREYACGYDARHFLEQLIAGQSVSCISQSTDQYGRIIARCFNHVGEDLEAQMVLNGQAVAYHYYSSDYDIEEMQAKSAGKGIWAGEFEQPYEFRQR